MWLFWTVLLLIVWVHIVVLGLLMFAPERVEMARTRWPQVVRAIERGQMVLAALMLLGAAIGVTALMVWTALHLPTPP
jgi:hypothetical protein